MNSTKGFLNQGEIYGKKDDSSDDSDSSSEDEDATDQQTDKNTEVQTATNENEENTDASFKYKYEVSNNLDAAKVRMIFEHALDQNKGEHHDIWMAYALFERRFGSMHLEGKVRQRGNTQMDPRSLHASRALEIDMRNNLYMSESEIAELESEVKQHKPLCPPKLPGLLFSVPSQFFKNPHSVKVKQERKKLFRALADAENSFTCEPEMPTNLDIKWYVIVNISKYL